MFDQLRTLRRILWALAGLSIVLGIAAYAMIQGGRIGSASASSAVGAGAIVAPVAPPYADGPTAGVVTGAAAISAVPAAQAPDAPVAAMPTYFPMPAFSLTDQNDRAFDSSSLHG